MSWEIKAICNKCGKKSPLMKVEKYSMGTCIPKGWSGVGHHWDNGTSIMEKATCDKCTRELVEKGRFRDENIPSI